jgi:transmembrane sensor
MNRDDEELRTTRPSEVESIEATAAAWLAQRDEGFSDDEAERFAAWRAADRRHEEAITRLAGVWSSLQDLRGFRPAAERHPDCDLLHRRSPRVLRGLLAASAVCAAVIAGWLFLQRPAPAGDAYATTTGGYQRVTLADGSLAELNAATDLTVSFTRHERRVRLARGEAHFIVAKDAARPFLVEAQGVKVRALGTAFNLRIASEQVEVLVTEGRVAVGRHPDQSAEVTANERAIVPSSAARGEHTPPQVHRLDPAAVRDALAWQGLRITFHDTPLADAIRQFNVRNLVQIELGDADIGTLPIGGSFRVENVDGFVRLLENGGEVVASRPDSGRIILRRAK